MKMAAIGSVKPQRSARSERLVGTSRRHLDQYNTKPAWPGSRKLMSETPKGRIVTFYSYKGGTGRSMALANIGWILASNGKRVLVIDWDLEAPGLHRYFHPFLRDKELALTEGVIDFVVDFSAAALTPQAAGDPD